MAWAIAGGAVAGNRRIGRGRNRCAVAPENFRSRPLILPYHVAVDQAREAKQGEGKIGTTGAALGRATKTRSRAARFGLHDIFAPERFKECSSKCWIITISFCELPKANPVTVDAVLRIQLQTWANAWKPMIGDVSGELQN